MMILGSNSPRRKEILSFFDIDFMQESPDFDEEAIPFSGDPISYVQELSEGKALSLSKKFPDDIILSADTIVYKEGSVYGKPRNFSHAIEQLKQLSAGVHSVFTGVTVQHGAKKYSAVEGTRVYIHELTEKQIIRYLEKIHCHDKAGGYAIQQNGCIIVEKIEGCFYNVMGLPITTTHKLLLKFGINFWD
jgi:septum formation protein